MKKLKSIFIVLWIILFSVSMNLSAQEKYFDRPEEAIQKAKTDLMEILKKGEQFKFKLSPDQLEKAQPMANIKYFQVDFNTLLQNENVGSMRELKPDLKYYVAPLGMQGNIITLVEINNFKQGWGVVGLMNSAIGDELQQLPREFRLEKLKSMTIYEVPNINAMLYVFNDGDKEMVFTNYSDRFSMKQAMPVDEVYKVIKPDAEWFMRKHGEKLKDGKLVK